MEGVEVIHGDCLGVMPTLSASSIDLVLADLPYGTTSAPWDSVIPLEPMWSEFRRLLKPTGAVVLTACQPFTSMLVMSNREWFRYEWTWIRGKKASGHLDAKKRPLRRHETVLVFASGPTTYNPIMSAGPRRNATKGDRETASSELYRPNLCRLAWNSAERYPTDVIEIDAIDARQRDHPTQKPVALMEYLVRTYSNEGETVLDCTMGSGTTGVACIRALRRFVGIEMKAEYVDVARRRLRDAETPLFDTLDAAS